MHRDQERSPDLHHGIYSKTIFGFWIYLLTDFMVFAVLFAAYAVLRNHTYGGPSGRELFHLPETFVQTLVLLGSSLTSGLFGMYAHRHQRNLVLLFLSVTFLLGVLFLWLEWNELSRFVMTGNDWKRSAFLSALFTLLLTHSLHLGLALCWTLFFFVPVWRSGMTDASVRRVTCLRMFWQFLTMIWVFIFTIVYLMGSVSI